MSKIIVLVVSFLAYSRSAPAQRNPQQLPTGGNLTFTAMATTNPATLLDLTIQSQLIVDGTVNSILPPVNSSSDPTKPAIETHSVVAVNAVLKGTVPNSSSNILIAQVGGNSGGWNVATANDPLVAAGERYILFLVPDVRAAMPNTSGMPRYAAIGVSIGKPKVANGVVHFAPNASAQLHGYDGMSVGDFVGVVQQTLKHPWTDSSLPINLAPKQ